MKTAPIIKSISRAVSGWERLLEESKESVASVQEKIDDLRSKAESLEKEAEELFDQVDELEQIPRQDIIKDNLGEAIARERLYGEDVHAPDPYLVFMDQKRFKAT